MADRSEESTRERRSTEDLLEETERLLDETGTGTGATESTEGVGADVESGAQAPNPASDLAPESTGSESVGESTGDGDAWWRPGGDTTDASGHAERTSTKGLRSRLTPSASVSGYFSPRAFLALVLLLGAGMIAGGTTLPAFGRIVGMFAVAFLVGLAGSRRRYLEVTSAGVLVGTVASLLNYAFLAFVGAGGELVALGAAIGVASTLVGYYFGRDLRDGLFRDL